MTAMMVMLVLVRLIWSPWMGISVAVIASIRWSLIRIRYAILECGKRFSKTWVRQQSMRRLVSDHCKDVVFILGRKTNINPACDGNEVHLLNKYRNILSACPQWPKTALSREEFETHYGRMHRTHLWQRACNLFHGGTGDPLSKSDTYLRMFRLVLALRPEGAR